MLRLYKPIQHDIFKLQKMLEHLVCDVWCTSNENECCEDKLSVDFKVLYLTYGWLRDKVDLIYQKFEGLSPVEKVKIKEAFLTINSIEKLCDGAATPVYLINLPGVIEEDVKPLLVSFYETLLEKAKVPGTKKDYYEKLITANGFKCCPCCGLTDIEQENSKNREAFDHYLPKAHYPFASVNFENLVPLCHKCNSDRKGDKDPIENGRKAFYPFNCDPHSIEIAIILDKKKDLGNLQAGDLTITFAGDDEKIKTWNSLFDISDRYNEKTIGFSKTHLRKIKRRHAGFVAGKSWWTYQHSLDELISDYEIDKYDDKKFLKIPMMMELKNCAELIEVYG
jgi:hypothetical protein